MIDRTPNTHGKPPRAARESPGPGLDLEAVAELRLLGFSDHEAKVYLSLLVKSPATGYEVARIAALPPANVYATLEALESRGTIQLVAGKPKRYVPLPPETVTDRIRSRFEANAGRLLSRLQSWEKPGHVDYIWHIEGKDELEARIGTLIRSATTHVGIRARDAVLKTFEADLRHAAEKGARVVMVLFGTLQPGFGHVFAHHIRGMTPIGDVENTIVVTVDHEHALVASLQEHQGAETRSKAFVSVVNTVIRHDVYLSEIFRRLGPVVDKTFGPALLSLRRILLPRPVIAELKSKLAKTGRLEGRRAPSRGRAPSK
jgi:sugar-specific transcriptional regulator TrmB